MYTKLKLTLPTVLVLTLSMISGCKVMPTTTVMPTKKVTSITQASITQASKPQATSNHEGVKQTTLTSDVSDTRTLSASSPPLMTASEKSVDNLTTQSPEPKSKPLNKFAMDWSKIDARPSVAIRNTPKPIRFYGDIPEIAKTFNLTEAEVYRQQVLRFSVHSTGLLDKIKRQLKDRFVDLYWDNNEPFSLVIVTRQDVKAETHDYVFQKNKAKGFSLPIVILPIADRSAKQMRDIYKDNKVKAGIKQILSQYDARLTMFAYTPVGFQIDLTISYPSRKLTEADFAQMQAQLSELMGVKVHVERRSISVMPL